MSVPDYQSLMLPVLEAHAGGGEVRRVDLRHSLALKLALSSDDLEEMLPSGTQRTFDNRVNWAVVYLNRAGLLRMPRRGRSEITEVGEAVLDRDPGRIGVAYLQQFPGFREFQNRSAVRVAGAPAGSSDSEPSTDEQDPRERLEDAYEELKATLADELLHRLVDGNDRFFEQVVLDVLVGMGYGGSRREAAKRVGGSGDNGIDGLIREDRLGLDTIYVQAKKWNPDRPVGPREIREFVGALRDAGAIKGAFITTSRFSPKAEEVASRHRISLVDGRTLAELMIEFEIGVSKVRDLTLSRIDEDYFSEEGDLG
jgi:restriction system protein